MKCFMSSALCRTAALSLAVLGARQATAVPITLNLVPAQSALTVTGTFGGIPIAPQEGVGGTTDLVAGSPSNRTTFSGTITVDVDNLLAPTSIKILNSAADAALSGKWRPEIEPFQDKDNDGRFGEFGDDSESTTNNNWGTPIDADWAIKVVHPAFGVDIAYGGYRDIAYNVTSGTESVNGLGQFSSLTENFEFSNGWLDYWIAPGAGGLRGRAELTGGDDNNTSAALSSYVVTPLGGGMSQITLTLPIHVDDNGSDLHGFYDGTFVATTVVPEPGSLSIVALVAVFAGFCRRR